MGERWMGGTGSETGIDWGGVGNGTRGGRELDGWGERERGVGV